MRRFLMVVLIAWMVRGAVAQSAPAPAWSPAKSIGMFVYPKGQQNADQQLKDESDCYGSAKQNSGVDPQAPAPTGPSAQQQQAAQQQAAQQAKQDVPREALPEVLQSARSPAMLEKARPLAPLWER